MRFRGLLVTCWLAMWSTFPTAFAAPAGPRGLDLPVDAVITNPDWAERPSAEDLGRHYPQLGQFLELSGRAVISCTVSAEGRLHDCSVVEETPTGIGFGRAALEMASRFRMKPRTLDGQPVGGGTVRVPIKFDLSAGRVATPVGGPPDPPPDDPEELTLARRMSKAVRGRDTPAMMAERMYGPTRRAYAAVEGMDPENARARTAALDAVDKAAQDAAAIFDERIALSYARLYTKDELKVLVAFFEGPGGDLWAREGAQIAAASQQANIALIDATRAGARKRFCAQVQCLPEDAGR